MSRVFGSVKTIGILFLCIAIADEATSPRALAEDLSKQWQLRVEQRYREFEGSLEKLAEVIRPTDPARADLLSKAFRESKKELVAVKLRELIGQIEKGEIKEAVSQQQDVIADMNAVLQLLISEDRAERVEERRAKLEMYAKQVQQLSDEQRRLRSSTEQMDPTATDEIENQQSKLAEQTNRLREDESKSARDSENRNRPEDENALSKETSQTDEQNAEKRSPMTEPDETKASDRDKSLPKSEKSSEQISEKPKSTDEPMAPPEDGQKAEEPSSQPSMPGDDHLSKAEQSMKAARQKIRDKEKELALREQDEAIKELERSTDELKKELDELREEEKKGKLSDLETRLRTILDLEQQVYDETLSLNEAAGTKRGRAEEQKGLELSRKQSEIVAQLDQVLGILLADGTAVAFPETIEQLSRDGEAVAKRLAVCDTGAFTQHVEKDILDSLSEMIQSLQRELGKKREDNPSRNGESGNEDSSKSPLVEQLSELKMIRSLQHRINERTTALKDSKQTGVAHSAELQDTVRDLADRQKRVYEITRDVAREGTP